jgi:hypothetical protein
MNTNFFPLALQQDSGLGRLHETFRFTSLTIDLGQLVGPLKRVISSSQGLYVYISVANYTDRTTATCRRS